MLHLNLLAPSDRHRADRGDDDDEPEPEPECEPADAGTPAPPGTGRDLLVVTHGHRGRIQRNGADGRDVEGAHEFVTAGAPDGSARFAG